MRVVKSMAKFKVGKWQDCVSVLMLMVRIVKQFHADDAKDAEAVDDL